MKLIIKYSFWIAALVFQIVFAAALQTSHPILLSAHQVIPNLNAKIYRLKAKTTLPIIFPHHIPVTSHSQKYYLSIFPQSDNDQYIINIDSTPTCNGIKYCNVGSLIVRRGGKVGQESFGNTKSTEVVKLANGEQAFYTPAHAEADYWPTMLQWKSGNLAYYLSWTINQKNWDQKEIIIQLANSALQK